MGINAELSLESVDQREQEYVQNHFERYSEIWRIVERTVQPPARILEVGTLFGHIAVYLQYMGYQVCTTDIEEEAAIYRNRLAKHHGILEYVCDLNTENLPLPDNYFDLVLFTEVLEHINPSTAQKAVSEISRVLRPGGYLLLGTPNVFNLGSRLRMMLGHKFLCLEHIREYSLGEVKALINGENLFRASGGQAYPKSKVESRLRITEEWYSLVLDWIKYGPWKMRVARKLLLPFKLIYPRFRTQIFILAVKT